MPKQTLSKLFAVLMAFSGGWCNAAPIASTDHLDRIILLMAVNLSGAPAQLPSPDRSSLALYGAVSAEAAIAAMQEFIKPLGEEQAKSIRFAPVSYRYMLNASSKLNQSKASLKTIILPDPSQFKEAERLYEQQGLSTQEASKLTTKEPTVFCPEPAVYAQISGGKGSSKRFIPCSFDYATLSNLISTKTKSKVSAIPWTSFTRLLADGKQEYLKDIEVLLSPSTQQAIQKTRDDKQFLRSD